MMTLQKLREDREPARWNEPESHDAADVKFAIVGMLYD